MANWTPASRSSNFVNHSYDYRPNWTPLGPITIVNYKKKAISVCVLFYWQNHHNWWFSWFSFPICWTVWWIFMENSLIYNRWMNQCISKIYFKIFPNVHGQLITVKVFFLMDLRWDFEEHSHQYSTCSEHKTRNFLHEWIYDVRQSS